MAQRLAIIVTLLACVAGAALGGGGAPSHGPLLGGDRPAIRARFGEPDLIDAGDHVWFYSGSCPESPGFFCAFTRAVRFDRNWRLRAIDTGLEARITAIFGCPEALVLHGKDDFRADPSRCRP